MQILEMIHVREDYSRQKISQHNNAITVFSTCNFPNIQADTQFCNQQYHTEKSAKTTLSQVNY